MTNITTVIPAQAGIHFEFEMKAQLDSRILGNNENTRHSDVRICRFRNQSLPYDSQ